MKNYENKSHENASITDLRYQIHAKFFKFFTREIKIFTAEEKEKKSLNQMKIENFFFLVNHPLAKFNPRKIFQISDWKKNLETRN